MSPTAVLTGAHGYVGSLLRRSLDQAGWKTTALVRQPQDDDNAFRWSLGDSPPDEALRSADALIHCAYDFGPRRRDDIWRINVDGSRLLLESARVAGVSRLMVISSMSAYLGSEQLYGQAKLAIEDSAMALGGIAIRPGLVYGDSPGAMAGTLLKLTRLPIVPVLGRAARQFPVHEADLASAVVTILGARDWEPEVIGVAQPNAVSFRTLLSSLAATEQRRCRFLPVPWQAVYWSLRVAESIGASLPLRSDSVLGLVRPAPSVPRSTAFPGLLDALRVLGPPEQD